MTKIDHYRQNLRSLPNWDDYLRQESGLPGPRGNLELARAVAAEGAPALFHRYRAITAEQAPTNTPGEFLAFCGVLGLGCILAAGDRTVLLHLQTHAADPRWRVREAVAMALQCFGEVDMPSLLLEMDAWSRGNRLEQRAAVAALCEPALLDDPNRVAPVLDILERVTISIIQAPDRRSPEFKALRKSLGYCWSVAIVAYPQDGQSRMESWFSCPDPDVRWVMRTNLKKKRLVRLDSAWVESALLRCSR